MATQKPSKPNVTLPESFGGTKYELSDDLIRDGYPETVPTIVDGGNINWEKDAVFKNNKYLRAVADTLVDMPIGKILTVDSNNRFEYQTQINDDTVVHKTGDEEINGLKTFINENNSIALKSPSMVAGETGTSKFAVIKAKDKNGQVVGYMGAQSNTLGANVLSIVAYDPRGNTQGEAGLGVLVYPDGRKETFCSVVTPDGVKTNQLVTAKWVSNNSVAFNSPSTKYIDFTVSSSDQQFTAPADGFFVAYGNSGSSDARILLRRLNDEYGHYGIYRQLDGWRFAVRVGKGEKYTLSYQQTPLIKLRFYYAKGSEQ